MLTPTKTNSPPSSSPSSSSPEEKQSGLESASPRDEPRHELVHETLELENFVVFDNGTGPSLEGKSETCKCCSLSPKIRAYKNVIGAGLSFMFVVSTVLAVASLQSSLNDDKGLGLGTLSTAAFTFLISGFFTSSFIKILGTKYAAISAYMMSFVYLLTNFYPRWYTLIPGCIFYGLSLGPQFASLNVHVTTIAIKYAPDLNEKSDHLIALFTGIFTMFYKFSYVPGNLATTIILFSERHSSDSEIIDTSLGDVCNNTEVDTLNTTYVYILLSCFIFMSFCGILIAGLLMDHLGSELKFQSFGKAFNLFFKDPFLGTIKMFTSWKMYMIIPMMLTSSFVTSSTIGTIAKYYVSDCIGFQWLGLFSLIYGSSSAIGAVVTGRLVKWIPQFIIVYIGSALMLANIMFLLFWGREPSYIIAFLPTAIIGSCEGMWNAVPPTLIGMLFPDEKEFAYSALRMGFALGFLLGFFTPLFIETYISLCLEITLVVISLLTYSILVFITQSKKQLLPCLY